MSHGGCGRRAGAESTEARALNRIKTRRTVWVGYGPRLEVFFKVSFGWRPPVSLVRVLLIQPWLEASNP